MSEVNNRKQLKIPPSHDVGVHFYYRNLLAGSDYVQAYIREYIALFDEPHAKFFEAVNAGEKIDSSERRQMPYEALVAVLEDAGVGEKILGQIKEHISHLAGGLGKPLDYLRVREFLSFCGIDGIFDLESKQHIRQERKVRRIPPTIVPERWRAAPDVEDIRQDIAFMMDNTNRIPELDAQIKKLNSTVWGEFIVQVTKDVQNTPVPTDLEPLRLEYLQARPALVPLNEELLGLNALRASTIVEMKDQYAPMDPDFKLPALGIEFDKSWYDQGEALINRQKPYRQIFDKYMASLGHKKGDPEYDSFDWQNIRSRSFAIWDWTYRDYTASPVNRGVLADARMGDFDKGFVKAVKDELKDGLLGILNLPYKIELVEGSDDKYAIVCNDCVTETFTLQQVYDLETKVIAEAEKADKNPANKPRRSTASKPAGAPPAKPQKPVKSAQQKEKEKLEREQRILGVLVANGVDPSEISAHDANGVKTGAAESAVASPGQNVATDNSAEVKMPNSPSSATDEAPPAAMGPNVAESDPDTTKLAEAPESASVATPVAEEEEEEELLFPDAGVSGEGGLDDNGNRIKDEAAGEKPLADSAVVNFGDVAPDRGAPKTTEPSKTVEKPATPKESTSPPKEPATTSTTEKNGKSYDSGKKQSLYPERPREDQRPQRDQRQPTQQYMGGGMGGGYGGGMRGFNPQSITVDMGLGHVVRSLAGLGRSVRDSLRPAGPNVFEATESLNKSVGQISDARSALESGFDQSGAPLTDEAKISRWTKLNGELLALNGQVKTLERVPKGSMDDDTIKSFKNAAKELNATKDFAKKESQSPGKLGELATEAMKAAEQMAQVLMNIVKAIMSVFSRNKSPSP